MAVVWIRKDVMLLGEKWTWL